MCSRMHEEEEACKIIGIPKENITWLQFHDGMLEYANTRDLVEQVTGIPCHELRPDLYRVPNAKGAIAPRTEETDPMTGHRSKRSVKSALNDFPRISRTPGVMGGKPCVKGSRMTVGMIVAQIGDGATIEELMDDFPELKREDIMEAIRYAGWLSGSMLLELDSAA